jgi:hypothetical protein
VYVGFKIYQKNGLKNRNTINNYEIINGQFHDVIATGKHWEYYQNENCRNRYFLEDFKKYKWFFCITNSEKKPTILILGNSFANDIYPGVILNKLLNHHSVLSIGSCDPAWADENWDLYNEKKNEHGPCYKERQILEQKHINNIIIKEKSIKFVILGGLSNSPTQEYFKRLKQRIDFLEANGIKVILFYPSISLNYFNPKFCYPRPFADAKLKNCSVPIQSYIDQKRNFLPVVNTLMKTNPNVIFFDPNITFCDNEKCKFNFPLFPVFRDVYFHYSVQASVKVIDNFVDYVKINFNEILN